MSTLSFQLDNIDQFYEEPNRSRQPEPPDEDETLVLYPRPVVEEPSEEDWAGEIENLPFTEPLEDDD